MAHQLWHVKKGKMTNITPIVGQFSWQSDVNQLGQQLTFNKAFSDERFFPKVDIEIGDLIILKNQKEIFRGIIVTDERGGRFERVYQCFDPAFYLNKSKDIIQFNKMAASEAISNLLTKFGVPIGNITNIPTKINKIFNNTVSEIIKEILSIAEKEQGTKYRMEMREGKLYIEKQKDLIVKGTFQLTPDNTSQNVNLSISNPSRKLSIENMRNSIKIVSENKVIAEVKNDSLISQYGLLQEVLSVDKENINQANSIAQNLLNELGKVFEENSVEMLGHDDVRAGRIIEIDELITGMKGSYLVLSANHSVKNGIHKMSLNLGVM